jgi:hypothetical protein
MGAGGCEKAAIGVLPLIGRGLGAAEFSAVTPKNIAPEIDAGCAAKTPGSAVRDMAAGTATGSAASAFDDFASNAARGARCTFIDWLTTELGTTGCSSFAAAAPEAISGAFGEAIPITVWIFDPELAVALLAIAPPTLLGACGLVAEAVAAGIGSRADVTTEACAEAKTPCEVALVAGARGEAATPWAVMRADVVAPCAVVRGKAATP